MKNLYILFNALDYIEQNLLRPVEQTEIASHCGVSVSSLQKLFRYALHFSVNEYISKRRLTEAAKEILKGECTITDVAYRYQYNSPEVFSRAFKQLWGITPSVYKRTWSFSGFCPRIQDFVLEREDDMYKAKYDISELYDELKKRVGSYILCFDIMNLIGINEISSQAGDLAIRECLRRIDEASGEDMMLFRIGGDEFALVTGLTEKDEVQKIADKVIVRNGEPVEFDGNQIPVSLWAGAARFEGSNLRYGELFSRLHEYIESSKLGREPVFFIE